MVLLLLALQAALIATLGSIPLAAETQRDSFWTIGPPAISALIASLAFIVTSLLFRRTAEDRKREQASKVYILSSKVGDSGKVVATVYNDSDLPIWRVRAQPLRSGKVVEGDGMPTWPDLKPGGKTSFSWTPDSDGDWIARDWRLCFIDADGRDWVRVKEGLNENRRHRRPGLGRKLG